MSDMLLDMSDPSRCWLHVEHIDRYVRPHHDEHYRYSPRGCWGDDDGGGTEGGTEGGGGRGSIPPEKILEFDGSAVFLFRFDITRGKNTFLLRMYNFIDQAAR